MLFLLSSAHTVVSRPIGSFPTLHKGAGAQQGEAWNWRHLDSNREPLEW